MTARHAPPGSADLDVLGAGPEDASAGRGISPWVWRVAGLLALGLVAVVAGPDLLSSLGPRQPPAAASSGSRGPDERPPNVASASPVRWVARGPEVGSDFAAAALARIRVERPGVDRLLWAGSLDGHDHVVVVSYRRAPNQSGRDTIEVAALRVRRAGDLATARSTTIGFIGDAGGLVGLAWQGEDRHTRLLVLGRPAPTQVQVSSVLDYHPSGRFSRHWQDSELDDGAGVTDLGQDVDPFVVVRPNVVGPSLSATLVRVEGRPETSGTDQATVGGVSSPSYSGPDAGLLIDSLSQAVSMRFDLGDADSRVLWSGRLAGGRSETGTRVTGRAALVLVRRHDGAMFRAFVFSDGKEGSPSYSAISVRRSVADRLPYAFSTNEAGAPLLLVSPSGPGSATLTPVAGPRQRVRLDANGVGTLALNAAAGPTFGAAHVVVRDRSGAVVTDSAMADTSTGDSFGLYL